MTSDTEYNRVNYIKIIYLLGPTLYYFILLYKKRYFSTAWKVSVLGYTLKYNSYEFFLVKNQERKRHQCSVLFSFYLYSYILHINRCTVQWLHIGMNESM